MTVDVIENDSEIVDQLRESYPLLLASKQQEAHNLGSNLQMGNQRHLDTANREQGIQRIDSDRGHFNSFSCKDERAKIKNHIISAMIRAVQPVMLKQLGDLRASVAKEACALIVWISQEYPLEFCMQMTKQYVN